MPYPVASIMAAVGSRAARAGEPPLVYLLCDEFTTDAAAPIASPRTCEPGPGTWTITGTTASIVNGRLTLTGGNTDLKSTLTPVNGLAMMFDRITNGLDGGFYPATDGRLHFGIYASAEILFKQSKNPYTTATIGGFEICDTYAVVLGAIPTNATVAKFMGKIGANWYLLYVADVFVRGTFSAYLKTGTGTSVVDNAKVLQLGAVWQTDYGIVTARTASPTSGAEITGTADGIYRFRWTAATNEVLDFMFRRTDDDNCWVVRCDQANSKLYLYEKNGGTETERGATGGVAVTFTNGSPYQITIRTIGQSVYVHVSETNAKISYTTAAFNLTATGIKVSGFATGENLEAWPRAVTPF